MRCVIMLLPFLLEFCGGAMCLIVLAFSRVAMVDARSRENFKRANADSFFVFDFPLFSFLFFFVFPLLFLSLILFSSWPFMIFLF